MSTTYVKVVAHDTRGANERSWTVGWPSARAIKAGCGENRRSASIHPAWGRISRRATRRPRPPARVQMRPHRQSERSTAFRLPPHGLFSRSGHARILPRKAGEGAVARIQDMRGATSGEGVPVRVHSINVVGPLDKLGLVLSRIRHLCSMCSVMSGRKGPE